MYHSSSRNDSRTWLEQDTEPYTPTLVPQRPLGHGDIGINAATPSPTNTLWQLHSAQDEVHYIYPGSAGVSGPQDFPQDVRAIGDDENDLLLSPRAYSSHQSSGFPSPISAREDSRSPLSPQTPVSPSWVRHVTDDGLSCYFVERNNGRVSWTYPRGEAPPPYTEEHSTVPSPQSSATSPLGSLSMFPPVPLPRISRLIPSSSEFTRSQTYTASSVSRASPHTVQRHHSASVASSNNPPRGGRPLPIVPEGRPPARNTSLRNPPSSTVPPTSSMVSKSHSLEDLYESAQEELITLGSFIESSHPQEILDPYAVDDHVLGVVSAIRSLLYVTASPVDGIPSHLYPAGRRLADHTYVQGLSPHTKRLYWDVVRTLSNLVSCSMAMQYKDALTLLDSELDIAVVEVQSSLSTFVAEARHMSEHTSRSRMKQLHGTFSSAGNDVVSSTRMHACTFRTLDQNAVKELKAGASMVERKILTLVSSSNNSYQRTARLKVTGQNIVARLSSMIKFLQGIDIEQHVDQCDEGTEFAQTKGRLLSRTLIETIHSLQEHNATFFMITQMSSRTLSGDIGELHNLARTLDVLASSIIGNLDKAITTLEGLVSLRPTFVQGSSRNSVSTLTPSLERPDSPTLSEHCRSSPASSIASPYERTFAADSAGKHRPSAGSRPSTSSSTISDNRRPLAATATGISSPLSEYVVSEDNPSTASESREHDEIVDMVSALMRPPLGIRTSLDSDTDGFESSQSTSFPSLPSLAFSDDPFSPDEDVMEIVTPPSTSTSALQVGSPRVRVPSPRQALGPRLRAELSNSSSVADSTSPPRGSKLIKVLGKDAPKYYLENLNADLKPWYLRLDYSPSDIMADPDGSVRAGTTKALVQKLTCHEHGDPVYVRHFLMTYKSFMTLDELFDGLVERFYVKPPEGLTSSEMDQWTKAKQHVIRMRVLNVVKTMLSDDSVLENEDLHILERMKKFLLEDEVTSTNIAKQLLPTVNSMIKNGKAPVKKGMPLISPPSPVVPRSRKNLKLLDIDALELARQLTIMESTLYRKIRPAECMARTRQQKPQNADNITTFIQFSNRTINWIIESVLSKSDAKKRANVVKYFINVAERCRAMQNFSSTVAIVSALNNPAVRRLRRTWEQVGSRASSQFSSCETIMDPDHNFHNYWSALKDATPPAIPFFGRYLSTLTFINDGAEDKLSGQMINFRKRQKAAEVIQDIKRWQSRPYNFHAVAVILAFIEGGLSKYASGADYSDQFYRLSLEREPRE